MARSTAKTLGNQGALALDEDGIEKIKRQRNDALLPKKIRFHTVTEDWVEAKEGCSRSCTLARAMKREIPDVTYASFNVNQASITYRGHHYKFSLNDAAVEIIMSTDATHKGSLERAAALAEGCANHEVVLTRTEKKKVSPRTFKQKLEDKTRPRKSGPSGKSLRVRIGERLRGEDSASKARRPVGIAPEAYFLAELKYVARERMFQPGWIAHQFKDKFGRWPTELEKKECEPREPCLKTRMWLESNARKSSSRRRA